MWTFNDQSIVKKNHMDILWHKYADKSEEKTIVDADLPAKASVVGRVGLMMLSCGTGAWRVRSSMNELSALLDMTCTVDIGLMSINYTCFDGNEGLELCMTESYDLILLDLNLPGTDGLDILQQFRTSDSTTPVLILSARGQIQDKVEGLDLGANDYLTKPFHFEELEARIRSLTRRKFIQEDICLKCGRIIFDTRTRKASVDDATLSLTRKESALLEYFLLHQGRIISPEEMIEHLWDGSVNSFSNSIRVHISSLRKKLRAALGFDPIQNKIGQGYILMEEIS